MADFDINLIGKVDTSKTQANVDASLAKISKRTKQLGLGNVTGLKQDFNGLGKSVENFNGAILETVDSAGKMNKVMVDAQGNVKKITTNTKQATKGLGTFGKEMIKNISKFASWTILTTALFSSIQALKNMVTEVKELDDAMTELSKVTDLTASGLEDFKMEAQEAGKAINATTAEIVQASSDFARMGFSEETSLSLAEDALLLTKIADGITEASEASIAMIAILKGFNLQASESAHILDALNEVSNNFAIGTDDLAEGLRRVSGVMYQANVSFEETIGLLVGANESLQNIEKSSSGLITMSTRLRGVSESGEKIEGLIPKLRDAFKEYADIDIEDQSGELRSTFDILTDLAGAWDTLSSKQQSYLGFLTSGLRQTPVLNSLMANLTNTVGATASAMNSAGSAQEEFQKVMQSLQGRLDKLSATWSRIANNLISSDFLKGLLSVADGISSVVEEVGLLNVVLATTLTILSATKMQTIFTSLFKQMGILVASANGVSIAFNGVAASATLMNVAITGGILLGVFALAKGIDFLVTTQSEWNEKINESTETIKKLQSEIDSLNNTKVDLDGVDSSQLALMEKELEIKKQLLEIEMKRNAELINNTIPNLEDVFTLSTQTAAGVISLPKAEDQDNLVGALKLINDEIERTAEFQLATDNAQEFENLGKAILDLTQLQLEHEQAILDEKRAIESVPYKLRTDEMNKYLIILNDVLGLTKDNSEAIREEMTFRRQQTESVEEQADSIDYLALALNEFVKEGSLTEETLLGVSTSLDVASIAIGENEESFRQLARGYGLSSKEINELQILLTNSVIDNVQSRILAYQEELKAISKLIDETNDANEEIKLEKEFINTGRAIETSLGFLDNLRLKIKDLTTTAKKESKEVVEAFKDQSEQIEKNNIKAVEKYRDAITDALQSEIDHLGDVKEDYEEFYDSKIEAIDNIIDSMKEEKDIADELLDIREAELEVTKAQQKFDNVFKEKTEKVLTENGFELIANQDDVIAAQEDLDDALNNLKDKQEAKDYNDSIRALEAQKEFLKDQEETALKGVEAQEEILLQHIANIENFETDSYAVRLQYLDEFVKNYNSTYAQLSSLSVSNAKKSTSGAKGVSLESGNTSVQNDLQQMASNSSAWKDSTAQEKNNLAAENQTLADNIAKETGTRPVYDSGTGKWDVLQYKNGGRPEERQFAIVDPNESIIPDKVMGSFISDAVQKVNQALQISPVGLGSTETSTTNENGITIQNLKVVANDPEDFARAMSRVSQYN